MAMLLSLLFKVVMEWIIPWTDMVLSRLYTKDETHLKGWIKSLGYGLILFTNFFGDGIVQGVA